MDDVKFSGGLEEVAASISKDDWAFYTLAYDISDQIYELMEKSGISRSELAKVMGTSKPFISKILRGDANLTFKTFAKIINALHGEVKVSIKSVEPKAAHGMFPSEDFGRSDNLVYITSAIDKDKGRNILKNMVGEDAYEGRATAA